MVFIFSLRGPLCAGEAFIPSRPGGPSAALCYMARRDVGPRFAFVVPPQLDPTYLRWLRSAKGGSTRLLAWADDCSCTRARLSEWPGNAQGPGEHGRKHDDWRRLRAASGQGPLLGDGGGVRERVMDGTELSG